mmetsp:Transcript_43402/g.68732  ORF Transcript_43402/g.68732 Transcript_43402/m.68732 type:complete len:279 (-) Transcript_43402:398-1234(-)
MSSGMESNAIMLWLVGASSAFGLKLLSSIDDVIWLAPFLTSNSTWNVRLQNSVVYTVVCLIQTFIAMGIAYSGQEAVDALRGNQKNVWSTGRILTVAAGSLLAAYSIKLAYEYFTDDENDDNNEECIELERGADSSDTATHVVCEEESAVLVAKESNDKRPRTLSNSVEESRELITHSTSSSDRGGSRDNGRQQTLFIIAFLGSVDDLTLFVPMLVGKSFDIVQLMLGAFVATTAIVAICMFIGLCKPIANCLSSIPLAAIVVVFATMLLVKGFFFDA